MKFAYYDFSGPFSQIEQLPSQEGVYVVVAADGEELQMLDCGESKSIQYRIRTHNRKECWDRHRNGRNLVYFALAVPEDRSGFKRYFIEQVIRDKYPLPCGKQ